MQLFFIKKELNMDYGFWNMEYEYPSKIPNDLLNSILNFTNKIRVQTKDSTQLNTLLTSIAIILFNATPSGEYPSNFLNTSENMHIGDSHFHKET